MENDQGCKKLIWVLLNFCNALAFGQPKNILRLISHPAASDPEAGNQTKVAVYSHVFFGVWIKRSRMGKQQREQLGKTAQRLTSLEFAQSGGVRGGTPRNATLTLAHVIIAAMAMQDSFRVDALKLSDSPPLPSVPSRDGSQGCIAERSEAT